MVLALIGVFLFGMFGMERCAWAWGAGAHVDFALTIVANAAMLTPAIRALLKKFPKDYLYGNLAADTVIGKNLAKNEEEHVHNWETGIKLFDLATDDAGKAFVYGYLSHLAADTVAHNYFVPKKRVDGFRNITAGHAYWELRYDSFLPEHVWAASRELGTMKFPKHDALLEAGLKATLFNIKSNKLVWDGFLTVTRRVDRWRDLMRAHAERSAIPFDAAERNEFRTLGINAIAGFLNEFRESKAYVADPTGNGNIDNCWKIGALLRKQTAGGSMDPREADQIAKSVGLALRQGLHTQRQVDLRAAFRQAS